MIERFVINTGLSVLESVTSGTTRKVIAGVHAIYNIANAISDFKNNSIAGLMLDVIGLLTAIFRLLGN